MRTQRLREKMLAEANRSNQTTLESLPAPSEKLNQRTASKSKKQIIITEIGTATREDESDLKISFQLLPSKAAFSKIMSELYFDNCKMNCISIVIPQGPLSRDDFELSPVLDMNGINPGPHTIKVDLYELWLSGEKLTSANKEVRINYVPIKRVDRLVKVPFVKHIAGADLIVVSDNEKVIYFQLQEDIRKEQNGKRDGW
jgi:hypothetical protein